MPIGALIVYNLMTTGHIIHPGYQHLYELEAGFYKPLKIGRASCRERV